MDIGTISIRYARALLKLALELGEEQLVYKEMGTITDVYTIDPELRLIIGNPSLTSEQKENILNIIAGTVICESTKRFIKLIVANNRTDIMPFIANSYITLYLKHKNITKARLIVPIEITQEIIIKIRTWVENLTKSEVDLNIKTDKSIGGGFILEYGTFRIDATISSQIRRIKQQLTANNC